MPRVDAFAIAGLDLWFHSADHEPAHYHVRSPGHWEIRVNILATTEDVLVHSFKWPRHGAVVPSRLARALRTATVEYREALLAEWESKVQPRGDR